MTIIDEVKRGNITSEIEYVAKNESVEIDHIMHGIQRGTVIIVRNNLHDKIRPLGIGNGLKTKININIGTSDSYNNLEEELKKVEIAADTGVDSIMDLSTGGDIKKIRKTIMGASFLPVGTVPIYQSAMEAIDRYGSVEKMNPDDIFRIIEEHGRDGVDFITVHCGVTRQSIERLNNEGRLLDIVSRGGSITLEWMIRNEKENPFFESFDRLIEVAKRYDMTLSLGDGLRPGSLADATDRGQIQELIILGELTDYARREGVQVMIEGPGHIPIDQIKTNIAIEKELCKGAPFYVLGPLVTDIAPGYDHITAAIGAAIAASEGADFLCGVTPSEHLRLPTTDDIREGIMAFKIAAHSADIAKGVKGAIERDIEISMRRKEMDWEGQYRLSIDPVKARMLREERHPQDIDACTMCGTLCSIKAVNECNKDSK
ncbi:MAG: phosphomethylpyrimidine synthase ThiC [Nitrospirota bacterium]